MNNITLRNMTCLYLIRDGKILLLYRIGSKIIKDSYTGAAGGHFEKDELNDPKACVLRELFEETGLSESDISGLSLRYMTFRLKNNEIRQNYYFFANFNSEKEISSNEGELKWVDFDKALDLDMPFSAKYVVKHYLEIGKKTDLLYGGIAKENGIDFEILRDF